MTTQDRNNRPRLQSIDVLFREEEIRMMKEGVAARAKENAAWETTKALMQRIGTPKAK